MLKHSAAVSSFAEDIEDIAWDKDVSYLEALLIYCQQRGLDEEYVASLVKKDPTLLSKLQTEAEDLNILPKTSRLPL